ncbi:DUF2800 domain-containing protein [Brevibacillus agri]|uniref:DUF2800 domain-containing protein n=2 Tax=Brevibacillus agri TaxID=51101 RepID=UPI002E208E8B|nr:DUF2800 domain-containing protein [Brevibacillus agri]MED1686720.1 DUF2800 domain-containing protein [Brevibacillus agri]MED1696036.1 DUF2800 domain-containing protein [Brevibacillus agri]MED1728509.1 DUF2800 domain-containing protein [Brevibacillus agri]
MSSVPHAERSHALLSASGAHRWLHCTPSARLEATLPDTTSESAKKGTLAHEIAELKLRKQFVEPMGPRKFNTAMKKFREDPLYESEMEAHTNAYLEYVQAIVHAFSSPPYVAIEKRVDLSGYVPESFGTSDCIIIGGKQLHVIDYKNGQGVPVPAENNPQMMLYALGALQAYSMLYEIETVHMAIVQPKVWEQPSEWSISAADLQAWGESIKPIAAKAFAGEGEYVVGEHCGFCRARDTCRARVEQLLSVEQYAPMKPPLISWEEVGEVLRRAEGIVSWYNSLKEAALAEVLKGGEVPGWKAVEGRGSRQYADLDVAFVHLTASGIDEALLYERKPLTPPALEKALGKKQYRELLEEPGHVVKRPGPPTLVPIDDARPAISDQVTPEQAFGNG